MRDLTFRRRRGISTVPELTVGFQGMLGLNLDTTIYVLFQRQFMELFTGHIAIIISNYLVYEMAQNFVIWTVCRSQTQLVVPVLKVRQIKIWSLNPSVHFSRQLNVIH